MRNIIILIYRLAFTFALLVVVSCKKIVEIGPPKNSITTDQVFEDSANATAAVFGLYSEIINTRGFIRFINANVTLWGALSSDEMRSIDGVDPINENYIPATDGSMYAFWSRGYSLIFQVNSSIEGLERSKTLDSHIVSDLLSECKFLRAISYYYLIKFYGAVPIVKSTNWSEEMKKGRSSIENVYKLIEEDLTFCAEKGYNDYSISSGDRARATRWAATALLARVYLDQKNYTKAKEYSSTVIARNDLFSIGQELNSVFLRSSNEVILSLAQDVTLVPYNVTTEGRIFIPYRNDLSYVLDSSLVNSFESKDKRLTEWIGKATIRGQVRYFPRKYRQGRKDQVPAQQATEHYVVLRLAEQYLIRAEANLNLGDLEQGRNDLNMIRERAGLDKVEFNAKEELFDCLMKERKAELFCEFGHRWFDLNRWELSDAVLGIIKKQWKPSAKLFPIPVEEIRRNAALTQNPGY